MKKQQADYARIGQSGDEKSLGDNVDRKWIKIVASAMRIDQQR